MPQAKISYLFHWGPFGVSRRELYFAFSDKAVDLATDVVMRRLLKKHGTESKITLISIEEV